MSLEHFKFSRIGIRIEPILTSEATIRRMETKSRMDRPAVEAVGKDIEARVGMLDKEQRKLVGRWVKEILTRRGWRTDRKGRVAAGNLFSRGTIYRPAATAASLPDGPARMAAARALVKRLSQPPLSVDEFLAQRRDMWGQ